MSKTCFVHVDFMDMLGNIQPTNKQTHEILLIYNNDYNKMQTSNFNIMCHLVDVVCTLVTCVEWDSSTSTITDKPLCRLVIVFYLVLLLAITITYTDEKKKTYSRHDLPSGLNDNIVTNCSIYKFHLHSAMNQYFALSITFL